MLRLPEVPGALVLALVAISFYAGHVTQQLYGFIQSTELDSDITIRRHLRTTNENKQENLAQPIPAEAGPPSLQIDPLNPVDLENFLIRSSNLTSVRPPIQPAKTGDNFFRVFPFQLLSWAPRVVVFPAFLDKERCEAIIHQAESRLQRSGLAARNPKDLANQKDVRTSSGTFLNSKADSSGVLGWVEERIAAATLLPSSHGEPFNVLRYQNDQHYDSHYDSFNPKDFGPIASQRIATVILYLSDVEEGGETVFKREGLENGRRPIEEWRSCDDGLGLKYRPRRGDAVLFWAVTPSGVIDDHALHGGCPVKKGEKWVATKWIRDMPMTGDWLRDLERGS